MPTVYLGNHAAVHIVDGKRQPLNGERVTTVMPPSGLTTAELVAEVTNPKLWAAHSDAPQPSWVASDDPSLGGVLAAMWGVELRDLTTVEESTC